MLKRFRNINLCEKKCDCNVNGKQSRAPERASEGGSAIVGNIVALFRAEKPARKWRKRNRGHSKCATNNSQRCVASRGNSAVFTPLPWLNEGKRDHACWKRMKKFWNWWYIIDSRSFSLLLSRRNAETLREMFSNRSCKWNVVK